MFKVVYNAKYGGYGLSDLAIEKIKQKLGGTFDENFRYGNVARHHPVLVAVVEELGEKANARFANLKIAVVEGRYKIEEYDGWETVITPEDLEDEWVVPE